mmetsp:Transcript_35241/g.43137  ORF Transcript_35241/g.43137 Transcript_35241/m.43137 type:complete len:83 (-) Transcript_35241:45-293(-)
MEGTSRSANAGRDAAAAVAIPAMVESGFVVSVDFALIERERRVRGTTFGEKADVTATRTMQMMARRVFILRRLGIEKVKRKI